MAQSTRLASMGRAAGRSMQAKEKPLLGFWQIWNLCFGFLGIQFGFALQNANASRIFQTLGADMDSLPLLWAAAPLTGLVVQPIVGYLSDRTWGFLGRRRPYFFFGAICTTLALIAMPHSPALWVAAGVLWILDASINVTMEPFRAFVGDMLPPRQRSSGYVMQSFFIALGAVVASALPWVMSNWLGVANLAPEGEVPDAVRYSFYVGAATLFGAVIWTVLRTREYSPEQLASFSDSAGSDSAGAAPMPMADSADRQQTGVAGDYPEHDDWAASTADSADGQQAGAADRAAGAQQATAAIVFRRKSAFAWLAAGLAGLIAVAASGADPQLYLLAAGVAVFGLLQCLAIALQNAGRVHNLYFDLCRNLVEMPQTMKRLAWVQFFSWFGLFAMWIYTTPAVAEHHFGARQPGSLLYNQGADWVGMLFAGYNLVAVFAAIVIPWLIRMLGLGRAHQVNLLLGALGFLSFLLIEDPDWLLASMLGVGFAWASIVSIPYAILANALPGARMGVFMGIFNFFIVIPQLLAAAVLGLIIEHLFGGQPIYALLLAGLAMIASAVAVRFVRS